MGIAKSCNSWLSKDLLKGIASFALLSWSSMMLVACSSDGVGADQDWREQTVLVQVGAEVFELQPGRVYALGNLDDDEINAAMASGQGTRAEPLSVVDFRIGIYKENSSSLDYDVTIVEPQSQESLLSAVPLPRAPSEVLQVDFTQEASDLSGTRFQGNAYLQFAGGGTVQVPVNCRARLSEGKNPKYLLFSYPLVLPWKSYRFERARR